MIEDKIALAIKDLKKLKDELKETLLQEKGRKETLTRRGAKVIKNLMRGINIFKRRG